jgi:PAS domain S-box-containing protein/putative nucleotidyltransferase with HDIG domain
MVDSIHVLLVEDEPAHAELVQRAFEERGGEFILSIVDSLSEARNYLTSNHPPKLIIADWRLPDGDGMDLLVVDRDHTVAPIVLMTSHGNERIAVEAMKAGALDYVVKSEETLADMPHIVERAMREWSYELERERMQATLREREAMFRLLAENSTDMISRYDAEGMCLYVSPASRALLGYEPDELVGHSSFEFIHPEDLPGPLGALNLLRSQDIVTNVSYRVQRKDGSLTWFETSYRALRDPQTGVISEVHAATRDITARRKAEDELRANEDRFRSLVQNSYEIILVLSAEGEIIYESPSTTRILGYRPGKLLGQTPDFLVHPDDLADVETAINGLLQKYQYDNTIEFRVRHANDSWIYLEAFGTNLLDHPGVNGIVVTLRDISDRKHSEVALQSAHLDLVQAYEATIEGWSRALDLRDHETEGHTQRVAEMTIKLAHAIGIPETDWIHIRRGALLHDIGKMAIPDEILLKPDKLTEAEWVVMRRHPQYAYEMLYPISYLRPALDIPFYHHEKWNGTGYPLQLKGEAIPLSARLFAVVDVFDALCSDRPYRKACSRSEVLAYFEEQIGEHFDPKIAEVFLDLAHQQNWCAASE